MKDRGNEYMLTNETTLDLSIKIVKFIDLLTMLFSFDTRKFLFLLVYLKVMKNDWFDRCIIILTGKWKC